MAVPKRKTSRMKRGNRRSHDALGAPAWARDPSFSTAAGRVAHADEIEAWLAETPERSTSASRLTAVQLAELLEGDDAPVVLDVRNPGELVNGTIPGSLHIPLAQLAARIDEVPATTLVIHCAGGWRSSVAASYLRAQGRTDISDLLGGFSAWAAMKEPVA